MPREIKSTVHFIHDNPVYVSLAKNDNGTLNLQVGTSVMGSLSLHEAEIICMLLKEKLDEASID